MSFQARRDRSGDRSQSNPQNSQQRWVPRSASTPVVVVNDPLHPPNTARNSESLDAAGVAPRPVYLQRQQNTSARPSYNQHQRSNVVGPPPPNRQRRNNALGTLPDNFHRAASRTRPVNQGKRVAKEENSLLTDPNLPQLVQGIQEKLVKNSIECMICYDMVGRSANIWSCSSCYSIFHMNCIKKWARAPTSIDLLAEKNQGDNWRCPGCQTVQLTSSREICYRCFCGKRKDPPSDLYLTPHSCGEPCGKPLEKEFATAEMPEEDLCPHICVLQCHPGPCPPCKAFSPPRSCPCGKKMVTTRCSERRSVLVCGQRCDKLINCGRHRCERTCHVGPCDPCPVLVDATCFCKKKMETFVCGDMNVKGELKAEDGMYSCSVKCGKPLGCGNHLCSEVCHPGPCGDCDLLPKNVKTCHCGKTPLEEQIRRSCLDPIPSCSNVCSKLLSCGLHTCDKVCHAGDCPPCLVQVNQKCRCGSTSRTVECYITTSETEKFVCTKPCGRKKSCGRHRCSERCCPFLNPKKNDLSGDWVSHLCQISCGKKLRCGQHFCESLCHSGHCPPCLEMIFTDLTCACGNTSIPPPLPCGTPVPSCHLPCSISQPCGHSATHGCHFGECPPCPTPVEKKCVGDHVVLRNIPCGLKDIRCNKICGKTRRCGMHACARTCHPEPCDSYNESEAGLRVTCGQTCGAPRRDCRHTCAALCHPSAPCPDPRCGFPVKITCTCGRITATVPCDAGGRSADGFYADSSYGEASSVLQKLPTPLQPVESTGNQIPLGQRKLSCDDECAKLQRKRVLQDAFDITPPNLEALHFSENSAMTEIISDLYRRDPKWVLAIEERCRFLVLGKARGSTSALKLHVFCPMQKDKLDTVRLIAERWKLAVSSAGWEPKRFTVVHVTPKSKPPTRIIGAKGGAISVGGPHPPSFDPLVDMDPGLVVSLLDLPRDANISALVLRFGGECELVWLNDKNALAVFHDHARAATAMRRLDHGSVYHGAVVIQNGAQSPSLGNVWGKSPSGSAWDVHKGNPWKKAVIHETDDSWGAEDTPIGGSSSDIQANAWRSAKSNIPIAVSVNRWSILEPENANTSTLEALPHSEETGSSNATGKQPVESSEEEVVDDWEKVCD